TAAPVSTTFTYAVTRKRGTSTPRWSWRSKTKRTASASQSTRSIECLASRSREPAFARRCSTSRSKVKTTRTSSVSIRRTSRIGSGHSERTISEGNELMGEMLPTLYIARHGETAWSLSGQYTGLTDLPLTERGDRNAQRLGNVLRGHAFEQVFSSPLKRARRTCDLAGFGAQSHIDHD